MVNGKDAQIFVKRIEGDEFQRRAVRVEINRVRVNGARFFFVAAERKFHPSQKTVEQKQRRGSSPESITIELRVARGRGLIRFILSWLPDVEVVSPIEIREEVRQVLQQGLEKFN